MASNTERSKKWRKKIRSDPSKHEEYKKKDRERKKKKYAEKKRTMSETEKSKLREKERLKKRVQAARKRLQSSKNTCRVQEFSKPWKSSKESPKKSSETR